MKKKTVWSPRDSLFTQKTSLPSPLISPLHFLIFTFVLARAQVEMKTRVKTCKGKLPEALGNVFKFEGKNMNRSASDGESGVKFLNISRTRIAFLF